MHDPKILSFLKALGLGAGLGFLAFQWARREAYNYKIDFVSIDKIQDKQSILPTQLDRRRTIKILHISDLHLASSEASKKISFLEYMTSQKYDFVFLTGDIFEHDEAVKYAPFLNVNPPRLGAYAVLGNHDYYKYTMTNKVLGRMYKPLRHPEDNKRDVRPLVSALENVGYRVMRNEAQHLNSESISILGIDFPGIEEDAFEKLLSDAPCGNLKLALLHMPKFLDMYVENNIDVVFGGHTHGGQVRLPYFGALITDSELERKNASGLFKRQKTHFHISQGLGSDPKTNFRVFCPPNATVIEIDYELVYSTNEYGVNSLETV